MPPWSRKGRCQGPPKSAPAEQPLCQSSKRASRRPPSLSGDRRGPSQDLRGPPKAPPGTLADPPRIPQGPPRTSQAAPQDSPRCPAERPGDPPGLPKSAPAEQPLCRSSKRAPRRPPSLSGNRRRPSQDLRGPPKAPPDTPADPPRIPQGHPRTSQGRPLWTTETKSVKPHQNSPLAAPPPNPAAQGLSIDSPQVCQTHGCTPSIPRPSSDPQPGREPPLPGFRPLRRLSSRSVLFFLRCVPELCPRGWVCGAAVR